MTVNPLRWKAWNMGVRDSRCDPKSYVAQKKTHGHVYHIDFGLCDMSRD